MNFSIKYNNCNELFHLLQLIRRYGLRIYSNGSLPEYCQGQYIWVYDTAAYWGANKFREAISFQSNEIGKIENSLKEIIKNRANRVDIYNKLGQIDYYIKIEYNGVKFYNVDKSEHVLRLSFSDFISMVSPNGPIDIPSSFSFTLTEGVRIEIVKGDLERIISLISKALVDDKVTISNVLGKLKLDHKNYKYFLHKIDFGKIDFEKNYKNISHPYIRFY